jgi:hypothetical protein
MLLSKFLKVCIVCFALMSLTHAETPKAWQPVKILGATYPKDAQFAAIQGSVEAKCFIRADGSVADVAIVAGHVVLARAVKANLLQWTFQQIGKSNKLAEATVKYEFQLKGSCDNHVGCKQEFWFKYPDQIIVIAESPRSNISG